MCSGLRSIPAAEFRRVRLLKRSGFNAVRTSHNPPSRAFVRACDVLGMIVMEEIFDCWDVQKKPFDYHRYFAEWWQRDTESMVLRDRNSPSVFFWSIGNEIPDRYTGRGANLSHQIASYIRYLDAGCDTMEVDGSVRKDVDSAGCCRPMGDGMRPLDASQLPRTCQKHGASTSRLVTSAFPGPRADVATDTFLAPLDVAGYNYAPTAFQRDHLRIPQVGGTARPLKSSAG